MTIVVKSIRAIAVTIAEPVAAALSGLAAENGCRKA